MAEPTPDRFYDLIMKGGVTSGVLYPPAICEIAKAGYLYGIGGTSAGAIAACLAAAAEYRRRHNLEDPTEAMRGYDQLNNLPSMLGESGRLLSLFEADRPTKPLFDKIKRETGLIESGWLGRSWRWSTSIPRYGWYYVRREAKLRPLVENHMGLCTGMADGLNPDANRPPLTLWLHRQINETAGLDPNGPPLTFGDLWSAPVPSALDSFVRSTSPSIDLKMITTCLTFGRPFTLPLTDRRFLYDPSELGRYFPQPVNKYLDARGTLHKANSDPSNRIPPHLLPLPVGAEMPVVVAMRMSLSFPMLFSMVPLWRSSAEIDSTERPPIRTYFSDGGITSNLPIQFFDSPLPRWPTLAINLEYRREDHRTERHPDSMIGNGLFIPSNHSQGIEPLFYQVDIGDQELSGLLRFNEKPYCDEDAKPFRKRQRQSGKRARKRLRAVPRLGGLARSIFRSAQIWNDMSMVVLPSYRQRVAEQWLEPNEGGMNLDMDDCVIKGLEAKGKRIGIELVNRFDPNDVSGTPMTWEDHRWVRMRASMAAFANLLQSLHAGLTQELTPDADYRSLIAGKKDAHGNWTTLQGTDRRSYRMSSLSQQQDTVELLNDIENLAKKMAALNGSLQANEDPRVKPFQGGPVPGLDFVLRAAEPYFDRRQRS